MYLFVYLHRYMVDNAKSNSLALQVQASNSCRPENTPGNTSTQGLCRDGLNRE